MGFYSFDELPPEIIALVFSFVPCALSLGRLQRVCKTFRESVSNDQNLWKILCLHFWQERNFHVKVPLELVFRAFLELDTSKNWNWLAKCFAKERAEEGLSFRSFNTTAGRSLVSIGEMAKGKLQNNAMEIYLDGSTYYYGNFMDGKLHGKGVIVWEGGANYRGDWKEGHREGYGTYQWSNGDRYEGEFKYDGKKEGKGTFIYADGDRFEGFYKNDEREGWGRMEWKSSNFVFEGQFVHNEPIDTEASLHPELKNALKRQLCTGIVTGNSLNFGQFFFEYECADYCPSCAQSCVKNNTFKSVRRWSDGTYCACVDRENCQRRPEPVAKKMKLDH